MRLMCDRRLNFHALSRELGLDFADTYGAELEGLEDLAADGIVVRSQDKVEVTEVGRPLLRVVAMRFDPLFEVAPLRHAAAI
jgi:oxygen-independent coproporphyrinogen-3 oxidase